MDSPIRQYQKQKDYLRHKLFRKIKRRKRAQAQQEAEAPLREMRRRVLKRFKDGKDIKRFDDGEDIVYESPNIPIKISYVPKSNVRVNPETGAVLTRDNQEGALMLPEVEIKPKRRLEQVYKSQLDLNNPISKKVQQYSNAHYWDPILGAPARWKASIDNGSNPLVALGSIFGVPDGENLLASANLNYILGKIKSIKKGLNRIKSPIYGEGGLVYNYSSDFHNNTVRQFEEKFLLKDPRFYMYPDEIERASFMKNYKRFLSDPEQLLLPSVEELKNTGIDDWQSINRVYDLFKHNPEYLKHWIQTGMSKNPLDQQTVADFIKRQGRSIRGVTAKDQKDAIRYLTTTQGGRTLTGGDRLGTHGGLYVSNHPEIADRFKNPAGNRVEDGYVGVLNYDFKIPQNLPIEDQLKLYRNSVYKYDGPLSGSWYDIDKYPEGTRAVESVYVGRANNGSGIERAYLPSTERGKVETPVTIEKLNHYPKQTDLRGRWFSDIKNLPVQTDMFIPKEYNGYDDFVRIARLFLKGKPNVYSKEYIDAVNKYGHTLLRQEDFRIELLNKLRDRLDKIKNIKRYTTNFGILSGIGIGGTALYSKIKSDQKMWDEFEDSQEYQNYVNEIRQFKKEKDARERVRKEQEVFDKYLQIFKDRAHYNSGKDSGIHINPKNQGKFNALKKRTGKTTEQLTHSKNPLTRKRAIFALNSKRWSKKK